MQIANAGARREIGEQRFHILRVAERCFAGELEAARKSSTVDIGPRFSVVAVDFDDFGLDVCRDQRGRRVRCDQLAVIDDREPRGKALGLVHEVRCQ